MNYLKIFCELGKVRVTLLVALTMVTGYILAKGSFDLGVLIPFIGVLFLALGSSAMNQYQERESDSRMERTKNRPLPSGILTPGKALIFSLSFSFSGLIILFLASGFTALLLGLFAWAWYNGVYTPLKRRTPFAVVPGALTGSIPPLIGWFAGGGYLGDPRALILAFFFFIWQVPHFWLLMLKYGDEYRNAGIPSITNLYSERQIKHLTFVWIFATVVAALMLPFFNLIHSWYFILGLIFSGILLICLFLMMVITKKSDLKPIQYFYFINGYFFLTIIFLSLDVLLN